MHMSMEIALNKCNKKQLMFIIDKLYQSLGSICEECIEESKWHTNSQNAVEKIRKHLNVLSDFQWHSDYFVDFIKCKMGEISVKEYRKIMGLEEEEEEDEEENDQKCIVCDCYIEEENLKVCNKCASEYKF